MMPDELLARCFLQWVDYRELMLTEEEAAAWRQWLADNPSACFATPGSKLQACDTIRVRTLVLS